MKSKLKVSLVLSLLKSFETKEDQPKPRHLVALFDIVFSFCMDKKKENSIIEYINMEVISKKRLWQEALLYRNDIVCKDCDEEDVRNFLHLNFQSLVIDLERCLRKNKKFIL